MVMHSSIGCVKLYTVVPKVLECIAPQAYPIPLAMNVSPSEKTNNFLQVKKTFGTLTHPTV